jgi:twitching motility protein PilT
MFDIDTALRTLIERGGSDLHVKVGAPPIARLHGELAHLEGYQPLSGEETEKAFRDMAEARSLTEFEEDGEADFAYSIRGLARFRVNVFKQRGSVSIVCRAIPFEIRSVEELGLPAVVTSLAEEARGIILVTGTTGSGKSTTLAAMIDHINQTRAHHIVTLEDPIEYLHEDKRSIVNQREVGSDTVSFGRAMRRVLRQDPDDPDRRDARRGDRADGALRRRDRPPRALHGPHPRRDRDDQPHRRLLPAPPAAAGAGDAGLDPEGRDRAAACA